MDGTVLVIFARKFFRQDVIVHVSGCVHARTCSGSLF